MEHMQAIVEKFDLMKMTSTLSEMTGRTARPMQEAKFKKNN